MATILRAIFASREVTVETLLAALCVFLLMGLFWAFAFTLIDLTSPGSFRASQGPGLVWADERSSATEFMRLFVFSYATLSGSNYAEVAPATGFACNAASLEAMTGQIYLAVVIARLVGLHATPPPRVPPTVDGMTAGTGSVGAWGREANAEPLKLLDEGAGPSSRTCKLVLKEASQLPTN